MTGKSSKSNGTYSALPDNSNNNNDTSVTAETNDVTTSSSFIDRLREVETSLNQIRSKSADKLKEEIQQVIQLELSAHAFKTDYQAIQNLFTSVKSVLDNFNIHIKNLANQSGEKNYSSELNKYDCKSFNELHWKTELAAKLILLRQNLNKIGTNDDETVDIATEQYKDNAINTIKELIQLINQPQLQHQQFAQKFLTEPQNKNFVSQLKSFKNHFDATDLNRTISTLENVITDSKETTEQRTNNELADQIKAFHDAKNKFFGDVIAELLAYRSSYQYQINILEKNLKQIKNQPAITAEDKTKKQEKLDEINEKIDSYKAFIFQIEESLDQFLNITWKKQVQNSLKKQTQTSDAFERAVIVKTIERFGDQDILSKKDQLSIRDNSIGRDNNNNNSSYIEMTNLQNDKPNHRKEFRALCNILKEAKKSYDQGKAVVQAEFEEEKEQKEKQYSKDFKKGKNDGTVRTYALTKEEKLSRKAFHLKVGDKRFGKYTSEDLTKNPLANLEHIRNGLKELEDSRAKVSQTKKELQNSQREIKRIKRNLKVRIFNLIEDYQIAAFSNDEAAAISVLKALKVLLKIDQREDFGVVKKLGYRIGRAMFLTQKGAAGGKKEFDELLEDSLANREEISEFLYNVALEQGLVTPEANPQMTVSKYATAWIQREILKQDGTVVTQQLRYLEENFISKQLLVPAAVIEKMQETNKNPAATIAISYNQHMQELSAVTYKKLQHGVDMIIHHPWRLILIPRATESVLGKESYGIDRNLYEMLLRVEHTTEVVRSLKSKLMYGFMNEIEKHPLFAQRLIERTGNQFKNNYQDQLKLLDDKKNPEQIAEAKSAAFMHLIEKNPDLVKEIKKEIAQELDFSTGLKDIEHRYFSAESLDKRIFEFYKQQCKEEDENLTDEEILERYKIFKTNSNAGSGIAHTSSYESLSNIAKHQLVDELFKDLIKRFFFLRDIAIPNFKSDDPSFDLKKNLLEPYADAFNNLAEKFNYPIALGIDQESGEYALEDRERVTQQKIVQRKLVRNVRAFSTLIAFLVMIGQVTAAFVGSIVYYGLATVLLPSMTATLLSFSLPFLGVVSLTATGVIFWPVFVLAAALMASMILIPPLKWLYKEVLRPLPVIGKMAEFVYKIVTLPKLLSKIPVLGLPFKLIAGTPSFAKKHPRIVFMITTFGLLASALIFPNPITALVICGVFSVCCGTTNYMLFKPDVLGLFTDIAKQGMKKIMWDKLGANNKHLTFKRDVGLMVFNAFAFCAAIAGPILLATLLIGTGPIGPGLALVIGLATLVAISTGILALNSHYYNSKKALMIAIMALIGFTTGLESIFVFTFFKGPVAGVLLSLLGISAAAAAPYVFLAAGLFTAVTFFGFFAVYYFCTGDLVIKKPLQMIKGFFKSNFYDANWSMRDTSGKIKTLGTMLFKGLFFLTGMGIVTAALFTVLSGKAGSVFGFANQALGASSTQAFNIGRIVAGLAFTIEGMFYGKNIAKIFTVLLPKLLLDKYEAKQKNSNVSKIAPNTGSNRAVFEFKLNSSVKQRNARFVEFIENKSSVLKSEVVKIVGDSTNDEAVRYKSSETTKTVIRGLKERDDVKVAWLDNCTVADVAQLLPALQHTSVTTLMLSNLDEQALEVLVNQSVLPSSIIFADVASDNIVKTLFALRDKGDDCKISTFSLGQTERFLADQEILVPDSVAQLYFACPEIHNENRNGKFFKDSSITAANVNSIILENLGAKSVRHIMSAVKHNASIKQIVLKNVDTDAIKALAEEIRGSSDLSGVEIILDSFNKSVDSKSKENPIDLLLELVEKNDTKAKVSRISFNAVPKKFIRSSERLPKYAEQYSETVEVANEGKWYSRPFTHFLPQVRRMFISYLMGMALPLNALGNSFSVVVGGSGAFVDPNHHWFNAPVPNPDAPTFNSDMEGTIAANAYDFAQFRANNSAAQAFGFGMFSAFLGWCNSFSVNANPSMAEKKKKRPIFTAEFLKNLFNFSGKQVDVPVETTDAVTNIASVTKKVSAAANENPETMERQPQAKPITGMGRFFSKFSYNKDKDVRRIEQNIKAELGFNDELTSLPTKAW